jgi:hypothetical protein
MTLFSMARPVAFKVPRAQALPTPFRPNCCNRVITHEREWLFRSQNRQPEFVTFHEPHGAQGLRKGTLREYIRKLNLSHEEFLRLLEAREQKQKQSQAQQEQQPPSPAPSSPPPTDPSTEPPKD